MYHTPFLLTCFGIGLLAASGIGPIFILTFNRGALFGVSRGLATALGAACADALYFFLALLGVLAMLEDFRQLMNLLDCVGAVLLAFMAYAALTKNHDVHLAVGHKKSLTLTLGQSLMLTLVNPVTILFFSMLVVRVVPRHANSFSLAYSVLSSCMVLLGSLTVLGSVACIASIIGGRIPAAFLKTISTISGLGFAGFSSYLFYRFILGLYVG